MKGRYGPEEEKFTAASLLVLCNRFFSMLVGVSIILIKTVTSRNSTMGAQMTLGQRLKPASPIYAYCAVAVLNFLATFCRAHLIRNIPFPSPLLAELTCFLLLTPGRVSSPKLREFTRCLPVCVQPTGRRSSHLFLLLYCFRLTLREPCFD